VVSSLRADTPGRQAMLEALAEVFVAGGAVSWAEGPQALGRLVRLPTYAWELERHWIDQSRPDQPWPDRHETKRAGHAPVATPAARPAPRSDGAAAAEREASARQASPLLVEQNGRFVVLAVQSAVVRSGEETIGVAVLPE